MYRLSNEIMNFCGELPEVKENVDVLDYFIFSQEIAFSTCYPTSNFDFIRIQLGEKYDKYFYGKELSFEKKWWALHLVLLKIISDIEELSYASYVLDFVLKKCTNLDVSEIKDYANEITYTFYKAYVPFPILRPKMLISQNSSIRGMSELSQNLENILIGSQDIIESEVDFKGFKGAEFPVILTDLYKVEKGFTTTTELLSELFLIGISDGVRYLVEKFNDADETEFEYVLNLANFFSDEIIGHSGAVFKDKLINLLKNMLSASNK